MPPTVKLSAESKNIIEILRKEIQEMKTEVSSESKLIISEMKQQFSSLKSDFFQLKTELGDLNSKLNEFQDFKTETEAKLLANATEISDLKSSVAKLENLLDDSEAYERRDTIVLSGNSIPVSSVGEKCSEVARSLIKSQLKIDIQPSDISTAHRLGKKPVNQTPDQRKIIIKLCRRDDVILNGT